MRRRRNIIPVQAVLDVLIRRARWATRVEICEDLEMDYMMPELYVDTHLRHLHVLREIQVRKLSSGVYQYRANTLAAIFWEEETLP